MSSHNRPSASPRSTPRRASPSRAGFAVDSGIHAWESRKNEDGEIYLPTSCPMAFRRKEPCRRWHAETDRPATPRLRESASARDLRIKPGLHSPSWLGPDMELTLFGHVKSQVDI